MSEDSWYGKYIGYAVEFGIMNGYPDKTFKPENSVTRAELAKIVASVISGGGDISEVSFDKFSDIGEHWVKKYIADIYERGIIKGYPDGTFRPDDKVTRAEAVKMLNLLAGRNVNAESVKQFADSPELITFSDVSPEHWAYYQILEASNSHGCKVDADGYETWTELSNGK